MALDTTQTFALAAIQGRTTLYEIALIAPDGRSFLVCYSPRSGRMLRASVSKRAHRIVAVMGNPEAMVIGDTKESMSLTGGWVAKFTGRTEREAIIEGPLQALPVEGLS